MLPCSNTTSSFLSSDLKKLYVLGRGNGGTVYKVCHRRAFQINTLKLVYANSDPVARRQLLGEIEIVCHASDSPHIVLCHGVTETPSGDMPILMEYMDLDTLGSLLKSEGPEFFTASNKRLVLFERD